MLLWFLLTAAAVLFVAIDVQSTPESPVLKWGFGLLTAYAGPLGAFLYVLGCREPLPGLHERYVAERWRQVLGSTMHCVAGDGVGILAGAVIGAVLTLPQLADIALEYALGFGFGWTIFQALFMRGMAGGSYRRSLVNTFIPEFVSMNLLMAGMMPVAAFGRLLLGYRPGPTTPEFWFIMSMALMVGFVVAFPINWWLVARKLKHGMMTVRPRAETKAAAMAMAAPQSHAGGQEAEHAGGRKADHGPRPSTAEIAGMSALSVVVFGFGIWLASALGSH